MCHNFIEGYSHYSFVQRGDLVAAYYKRLTSDDKEERMKAAVAWSVWEGSTSKLFFDPSFITKYQVCIDQAGTLYCLYLFFAGRFVC